MKKPFIASLLVAALMGACGGGDGPPPATEKVPASAGASVNGFIDYLRELVASMDDTLEPVDVTSLTPPLDNVGEPQTVD